MWFVEDQRYHLPNFLPLLWSFMCKQNFMHLLARLLYTLSEMRYCHIFNHPFPNKNYNDGVCRVHISEWRAKWLVYNYCSIITTNLNLTGTLIRMQISAYDRNENPILTASLPFLDERFLVKNFPIFLWHYTFIVMEFLFVILH